MIARSMFCVLVIAISAGCYYDVEEVLYPGGCKSDNHTYNAVIVPIFERECYSCHDDLRKEGGIGLEDYAEVLSYVEDGTLLGAIRHEQGYSAMPDGLPKLDDCTIEKIEKWVADGAPDN